MSARATLRTTLRVAVLASVTLLGACASSSAARPLTPAQLAAQDGGIPPYTKADVAFMQGMISHHAQAVTMSSFADANRASSEVRVLAGRIIVAQTDEIAFMKTWLGKRKQSVPAGDMEAMAHAHHAGSRHAGGRSGGGRCASHVIVIVSRASRLGGLMGHEVIHGSGRTCSNLASDTASTLPSMDSTAAARARGVRHPT
jgi:hypothetical protein